MEKRHSSPSSGPSMPRPRTDRKRSNSFPIIDALGCSTPEAELILAEGRAAIRSRRPSVHKRGRRKAPKGSGRTFRPQDHVKYLYQTTAESDDNDEASETARIRSTRHSRIPSNATDGSTSTITGPTSSAAREISPTSPVHNGQVTYSANLAQFIQNQLASIPSYKTFQMSTISPRSCPDLSLPSPFPQPPKSPRRHAEKIHVLEMPAMRPPLKSAFSEWSSTDDETEADERPPLPFGDQREQNPEARNDAPSTLEYSESAYNRSFLLPSTPISEGGQRNSVIRGFTFPNPPAPSQWSSDSRATSIDEQYASSDVSAHPALTASSAPSFSSTSTASYFDYKHPIHLDPDVKGRILAATAPHNTRKVLTAISPFEGNALTNVHDILVESQHRVVVEGMSFDLVHNLNLPTEGARRVPTPC